MQADETQVAEARERMVRQIERYGISDPEVLRVMAALPRHRFLSDSVAVREAYGDHPVAIGYGQTVSQPYIVAYMTEALMPLMGLRVLEIGTGSAYQAAVLARLGAEVFSVEIVPELARRARRVLSLLGLDTVHVRPADGYEGWQGEAPFARIIGTCAPTHLPQALTDQLAEGGRMILPVGDRVQQLVVVEKHEGQVRWRNDLGVRFVPMVKGTDGRGAVV